jgi:hypothetical protein
MAANKQENIHVSKTTLELNFFVLILNKNNIYCRLAKNVERGVGVTWAVIMEKPPKLQNLFGINSVTTWVGGC